MFYIFRCEESVLTVAVVVAVVVGMLRREMKFERRLDSFLVSIARLDAAIQSELSHSCFQLSILNFPI